MSTPTSRSLKALTEMGFRAGVVERYCSFTHRRHDLFGFADIVAVHPDLGVFLIQATAGSCHSARRDKLLEERRAEVADCIAARCRVEIWSWAKQGAKGKRKVWTLRREEIRL